MWKRLDELEKKIEENERSRVREVNIDEGTRQGDWVDEDENTNKRNDIENENFA